MSLTSYLKDPKSPVRRFFEERLPEVKHAQRAWRDLGKPRVVPSTAVPWMTVGAAFDYRFRYYLALTPPEDFVAGHRTSFPADHLAREDDFDTKQEWAEAFTAVVADMRDPYEEFSPALTDTVARLDPVGRRLTEPEERELCRYCYVLALFEGAARAPFRPSPIDELGPDVTVEQMLDLAPDEAVHDLVALSYAFADGPFTDLSNSNELICNPTFAGSMDVGGADADIVFDSCLIDIKTTKSRSMERWWIYQLLGYVLLDYEDELGLDEVGIYSARHGSVLRWRIQDLLDLCAGNRVDLAATRSTFRQVLRAIPRSVAQGRVDTSQ